MQGDPGGAFLVNVAVDQQYRGQGVGRSLIRAAVDTAGRRLLAKRLYTHVDCDNEAAWRLYQQQGFDVIDDEQCTLALPGEDGSCVIAASGVRMHDMLGMHQLAARNLHTLRLRAAVKTGVL